MKSSVSQLLFFLRKEATNSHISGLQSVSAVQSVYLLVKAMLLLNDKCVVHTPGKSSKGTEQGGERQEHERLGDLVVCTKSYANHQGASNAPQKWDSTQEQDQLKVLRKT